MSAWALLWKEIRHRKTGFGLGVLSVTAAMTAWIGSGTLLRAQDGKTERILEERRRAAQSEMQRMEDDTRRILRELGYNTMILPAAQSVAELRARGAPEETMPQEYAERLALGGIRTLNHLLPVLQRRLRWPEADLEILLNGTPGQVPIPSQPHWLTPDGDAYRNPILETIPPGHLVLGHETARALGLGPGGETRLLGTPFRVLRVLPSEGTADDLAVWCRLDWMQERLGMEGRIHFLLALECVCEPDSLGRITEEVRGLLPDVQVLEYGSRVRVRAQARARAAEAHRAALEAERENRERLAEGRRRFAAALTPLVAAVSAAWIVLLTAGNARERRVEIAVLRALGVGERTILGVFLAKSLVLGVLGAGLGFLAGLGLGAAWAGVPWFGEEMRALPGLRWLGAALLAAPALSVLAAWGPALRAIRTDPARILCEE